MSWEYKRRVKYYETDRMGVVHHSNYLRILEDARMEWLRDNLMCYDSLEKSGIIIPAVSATGDFLSYLHYDEPFKVSVELIEFKGVKMTFQYEVINLNNGITCYKGASSHFFAIDGSYKPYTKFRREHPDLYEKMCNLLIKN